MTDGPEGGSGPDFDSLVKRTLGWILGLFAAPVREQARTARRATSAWIICMVFCGTGAVFLLLALNTYLATTYNPTIGYAMTGLLSMCIGLGIWALRRG